MPERTPPLGPSSVIENHRAFLHQINARRAKRRRLLSTSDLATTAEKDPSGSGLVNYSKAEETIRNDHAVEYVITGEWAGNRIKGVERDEECKEYPKLRRLQDLKKTLSDEHAHPPLYINLDPSTESPRSLTSLLAPHVFDVLLLRPPPDYTWPEIQAIPVRLITSDPGFVFLWVGSSDKDGLERGREALLKWGFRRCEEIVWVKKKTRTETGERKRGRASWGEGEEDGMPTNLLVNQKEHCLVGIRGTVRRKTDNWFVHCNVDTDVIVYESDPSSPAYPPQLYSIIENFCLGARRLDLFAPASQARRGWVTVGPDEVQGESEVQGFDPVRYGNWLEANKDGMGRYVLPITQEIDNLRPKSPVRGERASEAHALPNRPGHHADRGRHHSQQGILSPTSMAGQLNQGMLGGMNPSTFGMGTAATTMDGQASNPMAMMNAMNMMNTNMNMGMPMMPMGLGMMGMGFPMMNMGMMANGMGMNPMMQGMFGTGQQMNDNQAQSRQEERADSTQGQPAARPQ